MALVSTNTFTTTTTGGSDHFFLATADHGQDWVLVITWAGAAGDADLQCSSDQTNWIDVRDASGNVVNITTSYAVRVPGGLAYRLDVNTHTSAATVRAVQ